MGKGKSHHGGGRIQSEAGGEHAQMDINTHIFGQSYGNRQRGEDDETLMGRASGSPSLMKSVFGAGWGRRTTPGAQQSGLDSRFQFAPELLDPSFLRDAKQVSTAQREIKAGCSSNLYHT